jgi:hypothetical protein
MNELTPAVHFDLVLDIGAEPIRGRVGREPQPLREFSGWIELAAALEAARTGQDDRGESA